MGFLTLPRVLAAFAPLPISIFARRLGRRDGDTSPQRNDAAVSTPIVLMVFGSLLKELGTTQHVSYLWLVATLILLFASIDHDRRNSWIVEADRITTEKKAVWRGIVIPDLLALTLFFVYLVSES